MDAGRGTPAIQGSGICKIALRVLLTRSCLSAPNHVGQAAEDPWSAACKPPQPYPHFDLWNHPQIPAPRPLNFRQHLGAAIPSLVDPLSSCQATFKDPALWKHCLTDSFILEKSPKTLPQEVFYAHLANVHDHSSDRYKLATTKIPPASREFEANTHTMPPRLPVSAHDT